MGLGIFSYSHFQRKYELFDEKKSFDNSEERDDILNDLGFIESWILLFSREKSGGTFTAQEILSSSMVSLFSTEAMSSSEVGFLRIFLKNIVKTILKWMFSKGRFDMIYSVIVFP